jgi:molybdopterin-binding protein
LSHEALDDISRLEGAVNCEVTLEIAPGVEIVSIITKASAASLGLAEGKIASAVIKASSVMVPLTKKAPVSKTGRKLELRLRHRGAKQKSEAFTRFRHLGASRIERLDATSTGNKKPSLPHP